MAGPQRLARLPGRPAPKRLGSRPLWIGAALILALAIVPLWFVLQAVIQERKVAGAQRVDAVAANPGDLLLGNGATPGDVPNVTGQGTTTAAAGTTTGDPGPKTDTAQQGHRSLTVHEEARLRAWQVYYQQLAELQQQRHGAAVAARLADPSAPAAQAQGGTAGGPGGGQGGAQGVQQASLRPGQLYQGPVDASGLYHQTTPVPAQSPWELKGGVSMIPFRLLQDMTSDAPGQALAEVTKNVKAFGTDDILVPQGAFLRVIYEDDQGGGSERLQAAITSITYPKTGNPACPGGEELPLGSMPAADSTGRAGFLDKRDRHLWRAFGNSIVMALGGAGARMTQPRGGAAGYDAAQIMSAQAGMAGQQMVTQQVQRDLNVEPSFVVRAGFPGVLQLTKTVAFAGPWKPGRSFCGELAAEYR